MRRRKENIMAKAKSTTKKTTAKKAVEPEARASTTATFLKTRVSKPTVGKWSSGFSAVKKYAEDNNIPLIAVWSNGDVCGHCVNFEKSISQSDFTKWQASSGCVFWFGCSSDTSKDDKLQGTGFTWVRNGKLTTYPFCRVYWKKGKVDTYKSGSDWTGGTAKGGATFVKKLKDLLKNFKPGSTTTTTTTTTTTPTTPDNGCEGGSCSTTCENCETNNCAELEAKVKELTTKVNDLETQVNSLTTENTKMKNAIHLVKGKWAVILDRVSDLENDIVNL